MTNRVEDSAVVTQHARIRRGRDIGDPIGVRYVIAIRIAGDRDPPAAVDCQVVKDQNFALGQADRAFDLWRESDGVRCLRIIGEVNRFAQAENAVSRGLDVVAGGDDQAGVGDQLIRAQITPAARRDAPCIGILDVIARCSVQRGVIQRRA